MANLTPDQEEQKAKRLEELPGEIESNEDAKEKVAENRAEQDKTQDLDSAFWNTLSDGIVRRYEKERRYINGVDDAQPPLLSEVKGVPEGTGRMYDQNKFEVIRVDNFDGGDLDTGLEPRENLVPPRDNRAFNWLRNGFNDGPDPGVLTSSSITDASTQFQIPTNSLIPGRKYIITGTNDSAIVEVTNVQSSVSASIPPFDVDFNFHVIDDVTFNVNGGTINSGATILGSRVFNNTERSSESASPAADQNSLENSFQLLLDTLNYRRGVIHSQLQEIAQNEDKQIDRTYVSGVIDTANNIDSFLASPDYSDTGLNSIEAILTGRDSDFTARITSIASQLNGSEQDYYEQRYAQAQAIGNRNYGSYSLFVYSQGAEEILEEIGDNQSHVSGTYTNL